MRYLWGEKFPGCLGKDNLFKMILHTFFRGGWEHPCLFEAPKQQEDPGGWGRGCSGSGVGANSWVSSLDLGRWSLGLPEG